MRRLAAALAILIALAPAPSRAGSDTRAGNVFNGTEARIDLPDSQRVRNTVGTDGAGLCVFASMDMAARWANVRPLIGVMNRMRTTEKGGGWPEKVERIIKQYAPGLEVVQYEGKDPSILDLAMKTGRVACVTYGFGEFYSMRTIHHMVILVHLDATTAAIIDNNDPLVFTWMTRAEFLRRWQHPQGYGWAYVLIAPPPPPPPRNASFASTVLQHRPYGWAMLLPPRPLPVPPRFATKATTPTPRPDALDTAPRPRRRTKANP